MNAPHIMSLPVAPAKGAPGGAPFPPGAATEALADFARLFADALAAGATGPAAPDEEPEHGQAASMAEPSETPDEPTPIDGPPAQGFQVEPHWAVLLERSSHAVSPEPPPATATASATARSAPAGIDRTAEGPARKTDEPMFDVKAIQAANPPPGAAPLPAAPAKEAAPPAAGEAAQLLAQAGEAHRAQPAAQARPPLPVAAPVGTREWREEFSAAVRVIAAEKIQSAQIRLNPPELGPVQVSLRVEANEATLAFAAPHAETRQALEAALPRLRELLAADGLALGGASIDAAGSGSFAHSQREPEGRAQAFALPAAARAEAIAADETPPAAAARNLGLVDTFA